MGDCFKTSDAEVFSSSPTLGESDFCVSAAFQDLEFWGELNTDVCDFDMLHTPTNPPCAE